MEEKKKIGVGLGVMMVKNGQILLGRRHDDSAKAQSALKGVGTWTMPGGKLDFGETFEVGAKREVFEETGIELNKVGVMCINQDIIETAHFVTVGMISEDFSGETRVMEPDEITEWRWFDLNDLPSPLYFPSAKILENYRRGVFYLEEKI